MRFSLLQCIYTTGTPRSHLWVSYMICVLCQHFSDFISVSPLLRQKEGETQYGISYSWLTRELGALVIILLYMAKLTINTAICNLLRLRSRHWWSKIEHKLEGCTRGRKSPRCLQLTLCILLQRLLCRLWVALPLFVSDSHQKGQNLTNIKLVCTSSSLFCCCCTL